MTTSTEDLVDAPAGLRNVVVTTTQIGDVRGDEGFYHYRQHSAIDLATTATFEEVWFLFVEGRLPSEPELAAFTEVIAARRELPEELVELLPAIALGGDRFDPLAGLRTALSLLGATRGLAKLWDADPRTAKDDALTVCAVTPTILAALYRHRAGKEPLAPCPDLSTAANLLYLITGDTPDPAMARAVERYLIATIDHGFNASTFTARVVASAGADVVAAVAAAIGTFSGPLHGGAPDRALDALDAIGTPDRIDDWVRAQVLAGDRIMGFGHAVYRVEDPRARMLREIAQHIGGDLVDFAVQVEQRVTTILAELKPGRELPVNVEFYAGVVMQLCGIPREMFTPTFTVSRVIGWCANILEQSETGKIIRPAARYVGPALSFGPVSRSRS
ncbi:citrate/2-methylcitrate synthase [Pseudonocardia spinosispora]|uniref:citrate/2-methylcitrate synthase n=1 Tax=Pseudonocardia spinosispora TaxID=103441 RepID=UPI00041742A6|nr:citrate/2-methylcitrate synthase [Pseudonocardia spinosispora]